VFDAGLVGEGEDTAFQRWNFTNSSRIPSADGMLVHINWWLFQGKSDLLEGETLEVVLRSFSFTPLGGERRKE
jgi:hypothetical protein